MDKKPYEAPSVLVIARVAGSTADSRENSTSDTFFSLSGPTQGMGGSHDTCVTVNRVKCL